MDKERNEQAERKTFFFCFVFLLLWFNFYLD